MPDAPGRFERRQPCRAWDFTNRLQVRPMWGGWSVTVKRNSDRSSMTKEVIITESDIKHSFLKKNSFSINSHPIYFVETFLPFEDNTYMTQKKELLSIKHLTKVSIPGLIWI